MLFLRPRYRSRSDLASARDAAAASSRSNAATCVSTASGLGWRRSDMSVVVSRSSSVFSLADYQPATQTNDQRPMTNDQRPLSASRRFGVGRFRGDGLLGVLDRLHG